MEFNEWGSISYRTYHKKTFTDNGVSAAYYTEEFKNNATSEQKFTLVFHDDWEVVSDEVVDGAVTFKLAPGATK